MFVPVFPETYKPVKVPFQKGPGQKFRQPSGTGLDFGFFELDDLSKPSPGNVFPLVISAETCLPSLMDQNPIDPPSKSSPHRQITQAVLEKKDGDSFKVRVVKQILWIDEVRYELHEIYGIGNSAEALNDDSSGTECVICLTEAKDTAAIPCRHMVRANLKYPLNYICLYKIFYLNSKRQEVCIQLNILGIPAE